MNTRPRPGVTATEFLALCKEHPCCPTPFPTSTVIEFLERCRQVGLVARRVGDRGSVEYFATDSLRALFYDGD